MEADECGSRARINSVVSRHQNRRLTYYELQKESIALAWGLRQSGVEKEMRVGVSLGNSWEYAVVCLCLCLFDSTSAEEYE